MIDKDFLTLEESREYLERAGFSRSFVWVKTMVGKKKIASELRYGRRVIHTKELDRVIKKKPKLEVTIKAIAAVLMLAGLYGSAEPARAHEIGLASYYTVESSSPRTASGSRLNESAFTCAHPSKPFGTVLRVTDLAGLDAIDCVVNDRGPARKYRRRGRVIDLTPAGFTKLFGTLRPGLGRVKITEVKRAGR
jgi:rare lipoprotein A